MKVRFLGEDNLQKLSHGKIYNAIGMNVDTGRCWIVDETNVECLLPPEDFEILDNVIQSEVLLRLMYESELERIEYTDKAGVIHTGFVDVYSSRDDNDGEASLCFIDDNGEMPLIFESDIAEIKILKSTVMREAFDQLKRKR